MNPTSLLAKIGKTSILIVLIAAVFGAGALVWFLLLRPQHEPVSPVTNSNTTVIINTSVPVAPTTAVERPPLPQQAPDSDRDGLLDTDEQTTYRTNPQKADTDNDNLADGLEVRVYDTDPTTADSDRDGTGDGAEVHDGNNPNGAGTLLNLQQAISELEGNQP